MTGIVITGGEKPDFSRVSSLFEGPIYICAADSGLDYCVDHGLRPDYIIGDMDSLSSRQVLRGFDPRRIEEHPEEKDYTDTELALRHLSAEGCETRILLGGGGGRLDHLLAVAALFDRPNPPDRWIIREEEIRLIDKVFSGRGEEGEIVSFFPAGGMPCRMKSLGLYWPLDRLCWSKGDAGISNRLTGEEFSVRMTEGRLIMIRRIPQEGLLP